ncbi:hypothetical protein LINPERHAP2_LOCUS6195 [Linum perenne]
MWLTPFFSFGLRTKRITNGQHSAVHGRSMTTTYRWLDGLRHLMRRNR